MLSTQSFTCIHVLTGRVTLPEPMRPIMAQMLADKPVLLSITVTRRA